MKESKRAVRIVSHKEIAGDIYDMTIACPQAAKAARPGQFMCLYCRDGSRLLPRPISICDIDAERGEIRMVYRIAGAGTKEFATLQEGDEIMVMGPLGNGFSIRDKKALLIGGGIGIPPMLALSKKIEVPKTMVLGFRDETFLLSDFEKEGDTYIATETGSAGYKGTVLDAINAEKPEADVIYACGPLPMLKAVAEYAAAHDMECQISLEERMACGIGACLGCICRTKEKNHHTHVHNARICKDGPVFDSKEVEFE